MKKEKLAITAALATFVITGCAAQGDVYRADVYGPGQLNQAQEVQTVEIIDIQPARIAVDNTEQRSTARKVGTVLGAIAGVDIGNHGHHDTSARVMGGLAGGALGNLAGDAVGGEKHQLIEGVQLTFRRGSKVFNSTQVGNMCEYRLGQATLISTHRNETRIQPNNPYGCGR
jgi:outer membrane lipoprotein SlyB